MKQLTLILFTILYAFTLNAQSLKGYVYEKNNENEKLPLVGTNVYWEGTQIGASTDEEGFFILDKMKNPSSSVLAPICVPSQ